MNKGGKTCHAEALQMRYVDTPTPRGAAEPPLLSYDCAGDVLPQSTAWKAGGGGLQKSNLEQKCMSAQWQRSTSPAKSHVSSKQLCLDVMRKTPSPLWTSPKTRHLSHGRHTRQIPIDGHATEHLTSPPKQRGQQKQGESEKLSQSRGAQGDVTTKCHVGYWVRTGTWLNTKSPEGNLEKVQTY